MPKFNKPATRAASKNLITTEQAPSTVTYEGAPAYVRDVKSELFLLALANFVGENTFYEKAGDRDARYRALVRQAAVEDPTWTAGLLRWLRHSANMRSAALVGAAEYAWARRDEQGTGRTGTTYPEPTVTTRQVVDSVLARADEPGELLAYWTSNYGRSVPKPVKRGVSDAVARLYSQRNALKWDTASHGFRFADVLELTHPQASGPWQGPLFKWLLDSRHDHADEIPAELDMIRNNAQLRRVVVDNPAVLLSAHNLRQAGMIWEDALSLVGSKVDKKELWEALIPTMGIFALARNLRNIDEAAVSDEAASLVVDIFTSPVQVARSRMLPYRWLAAYEQAPNLRWGAPLDQALRLSLANIPTLDGQSLVLIDTSSSMSTMGFSERSKMFPVKVAAVFGVALAGANGADLHGFADGTFRHTVPAGASVIREVDRFCARIGEVGHGTAIASAIRACYRSNHKRVFVITDEQTFGPGFQGRHGNVTDACPKDVPIYAFNVGGYKQAMMPTSATRQEFGGLTDATFAMVPLIEAGRNATWPWL